MKCTKASSYLVGDSLDSFRAIVLSSHMSWYKTTPQWKCLVNHVRFILSNVNRLTIWRVLGFILPQYGNISCRAQRLTTQQKWEHEFGEHTTVIAGIDIDQASICSVILYKGFVINDKWESDYIDNEWYITRRTCGQILLDHTAVIAMPHETWTFKDLPKTNSDYYSRHRAMPVKGDQKLMNREVIYFLQA